MAKKITKWEPEDFELEMTTHWSFPKRGDWATHDAKWRGNWSPYIPRNIILRYSQEGDLVLDQFAGGGTTLVEAKLLRRNIIGVDVNDVALARCREKIDFEHEGADGKVYIHKGDARHLDFIPDGSIDLICTHPPYADIIRYSEDIDEDLSHLKVKDFLEENGVKRAIINLGGNVLCIGKKTNTDNFGIGVRKPFAANNEVLVALSVDDSSVVSSGNYERYFYADDGTFYHHILNPATGYSYDNDLSDVTILSKDSLTGDCLSTTCFCLGLEDGMKLIESLDGIEAVFVTNEGEIHYSSGAKAYVKS